MTGESETTQNQKKQRFVTLFAKLLPLVDSVADKVRLFMALGLFSALWIGYWCFQIKHFSLAVTLAVGLFALLPALILARFWWALEELKNLPAIAGEMAGDAKTELQASIATLRTGKVPKLGILSAGKGLWSIGSMASEAADLFGSYFSIATVANPFMLALGVISLFSVFFLVLTGIILAFFAF